MHSIVYSRGLRIFGGVKKPHVTTATTSSTCAAFSVFQPQCQLLLYYRGVKNIRVCMLGFIISNNIFTGRVGADRLYITFW